jgi:hexokinase
MNLKTLKTVQDNFLQELRSAEKGQKTSLAFIRNPLPSSPLVEDEEEFQVLVIGGSVCKNALVKRKNGHIHILEKTEKDQPPFKTEEALLSFILSELKENVRVVAINFAYPLDPVFENGRLDGIITRAAKENTFDGLIGKKLGAETENYIFRKTGRKVIVSVANDTISLLLSGLTQHPWDGIAGGIVGTGVNFAMFLKQNEMVNLEAAWFDKFTPSEEGVEIDTNSSKPGEAILEKNTSGAYLYQHYNLLIKKRGIDTPPLTSTKELKDMSLEDSERGKIACDLIKRSAGLIASVIGGMTLYYNKDMIFVMEGSFFWGENVYRDYVSEYLRELLPNLAVLFVKIDDSPILGGAKLVA